MKKIIFYISIILGIALMSCNKDKDPIVVEPTPTYTYDTFVLDSLLTVNIGSGSGLFINLYPDTVRVRTDYKKATIPYSNYSNELNIDSSYTGMFLGELTTTCMFNHNQNNCIIKGWYGVRATWLRVSYNVSTHPNEPYIADYHKIN